MNAAATNRQSEPAKLELEIVDGLHKGASLSLDLGDYVIGSTADADIVLRDPEVAPEHAILRVDRNAIHIEAIGGDISVGDKLVTEGHGCRVGMPGSIAIGEARLTLDRIGDGALIIPEQLRPLSHFVATRPLVAAGGIIFCALVLSVAFRGLPISSAKTDVTGTAIANRAAKVTPALVNEAAAKLTDKLKSAGINSLKIARSDQRIAISGSVAKRDASAWASTQQWFDETYGGQIVLTANVAVGDSKNTPAFRPQAVWYGEHPYIILEDGSHYYEGSVLNDGWRVQRIAEDRIVLQKDGESLALTYR